MIIQEIKEAVSLKSFEKLVAALKQSTIDPTETDKFLTAYIGNADFSSIAAAFPDNEYVLGTAALKEAMGWVSPRELLVHDGAGSVLAKFTIPQTGYFLRQWSEKICMHSVVGEIPSDIKERFIKANSFKDDNQSLFVIQALNEIEKKFRVTEHAMSQVRLSDRILGWDDMGNNDDDLCEIGVLESIMLLSDYSQRKLFANHGILGVDFGTHYQLIKL